MIIIKDTERSCVLKSYDGFVHKRYRGTHSLQRLENEVRVLEHLRYVGCAFVPRLIDVDRSNLTIIQSDCGVAVQQLVAWRLEQLFNSLLAFGVSHRDCELRNVTYRAVDGRFCIVDFELATIQESALSHQIDAIQSLIESDF